MNFIITMVLPVPRLDGILFNVMHIQHMPFLIEHFRFKDWCENSD